MGLPGAGLDGGSLDADIGALLRQHGNSRISDAVPWSASTRPSAAPVCSLDRASSTVKLPWASASSAA